MTTSSRTNNPDFKGTPARLAPEAASGSGGAPARDHSIRHVAAIAGVSVATVSRVLNTPELVKPDTADRVRSAIRRLNYRPNPFAKGLTTRRSRLLGLSVPELHGEYYSSLVTAADRAARARGYHVLVTSHIPGGARGAKWAGRARIRGTRSGSTCSTGCC